MCERVEGRQQREGLEMVYGVEMLSRHVCSSQGSKGHTTALLLLFVRHCLMIDGPDCSVWYICFRKQDLVYAFSVSRFKLDFGNQTGL